MNENKKKLHEMIDSIQDSGTAEYLETFIRLFLKKWGRLPDAEEGGASND